MIPVTVFAGRTVAVFGLARSGLAAARSLLAGGASVACWDDGERGRAEAQAGGLRLEDLRDADWSRFAALVLAPGVPLTHPKPHWTVERAKAAGLEVIGDTELFFRELALLSGTMRPRVIGITGTNGKSTTTALLAHLLRHAGRRVAMGGNFGEAVLGLAPLAETEFYVLELSSYQIDLTPSLNPDVGLFLNLSPDHLDRHGSMEHYAAVKERLVAGAGTAIVGLDDPWSRAIAMRRWSLGKPTLGLHVAPDPTRALDAVTDDDLRAFRVTGAALALVVPDQAVQQPTIEDRAGDDVKADLTGISTLRGPHNAQNAAAAYFAAEMLDVGDLQEGLRTYPGLAHRMELLGHVGATSYVNDSKATNADSTAKALTSFGAPIHWILGGKAKDGGIESLEPFFGAVSHAYLIGEAAEPFAVFLANRPISVHRSGTLERAVEDAARATALAPATVLLSPACASFDQFKDFEDRGDRFRRLVQALPGFEPYGRARR